MGRKKDRQQERASKLALATVTLGLVRATIELILKIIDWLTK